MVDPMSMPSDDELMQIAILKKPYGIKGWLWVFSYMQQREQIFAMSPWYIKTAKGLEQLTVLKWHRQKSGLVAQFAEISDRNHAEMMNGVGVWTHKDELPDLADDEYYWTDLVGLTVYNEQNECLGVVKNLFETGANDVMTVAPSAISIDGDERLIPWHNRIIKTIDLSAKMLIVAWEKDY